MPKSRPARALWIEISMWLGHLRKHFGSRPARALWIEITRPWRKRQRPTVEAREGLVD